MASLGPGPLYLLISAADPADAVAIDAVGAMMRQIFSRDEMRSLAKSDRFMHIIEHNRIED